MRPAGEPLQSWCAANLGARVRRTGRGLVHSVFARAANLVDAHDSLTALLAADAPRIAHGVRLSRSHGDLSRWFAAGAAYRWEGEDLCIASLCAPCVRIATAGADVWHGRIAPTPKPTTDIVRAATTLQCWRTPPELGLRLTALADACRDGDTDAIAHAVHRLIGLGPGLTPAGDDALIGYLAGIALLGTDWRGEVLRRAIGARLARTTDVSRAHLEDALEGEFSEPLAQFANVLSHAPAQAQRAMDELACVGASSGLDAAAGLLAAVHAVARVDPAHA
jgi:hypothetical protein